VMSNLAKTDQAVSSRQPVDLKEEKQSQKDPSEKNDQTDKVPDSIIEADRREELNDVKVFKVAQRKAND